MNAHMLIGEKEWKFGPENAKEENEKKNNARKAYNDHVAICQKTILPQTELKDDFERWKVRVCRQFILLIDS